MKHNYKVTSCNTCPFAVEDFDPDFTTDMLVFCQLLRRNQLPNHICSYSSWSDKPLPKQYVDEVLNNCPLKEGKITISLL